MSDRDRFDKFTKQARKVLSLAQEEAQRFQHNYIGTEHILLGLVREGDGVGARVLENLGADLGKLRVALETITGRGDRIVLGEIGLLPEAKKTIDLAVEDARRYNHHYIGTEHILMGLARLPESTAGQMLQQLNISLEDIRITTIQAMSQSTASTPAEQTQNDTPPEESSPPSPSQSGRFDKFDEQARRVLSYAQEEAQRFQHNYIGTEHLLLGLIREESGVAASVLTQLGIELQKVRSAVEFIIGRGDRMVLGNIGLTPRAKKVIELGVDEARRLNHHYIGTEHILLGLVREGQGIAAGVLESLGARVENVRIATLRALGADEKQIEAIVASAPPTIHSRPNQPSLLRKWSHLSTTGYTLTPQAESIMELAEEEARQLQHKSIGPEHLLLSMMHEEDGITARVLQDLGIDLPKGRTAVGQVTGLGEQPIQASFKPTPLAMTAVLLAIDEADRLKQAPVSAAHLLLGLTRMPQGVIFDVLNTLGVDQATLYNKTLEAIKAEQ